MKHGRLIPHPVRLYLLCLFPALLTASAACQPPAADQTFDPHALMLLQKMADAYAQLPVLNQRTVFYSARIPLKVAPDGQTTPVTPPASGPLSDAPAPGDQKMSRRLRLLVMPPNRLRMEMVDPDSLHEGATNLSVWDSDGRKFWTYLQEKNWYTEEKAPARRSDFLKARHLSNGSLELMMLIGVNPFSEIRQQADSAQMDGTATVRGVTTDVVLLTTAAPASLSQVRIYIGHDDLLLRRVVVETRPVLHAPTAEPGKVGDELDALVTHSNAPIAHTDIDPEDLFLRRVTYDNILEPPSHVNWSDFVFKAPVGALLYEPYVPGQSVGTRMKDLYHTIDPYRATRHRVVQP